MLYTSYTISMSEQGHTDAVIDDTANIQKYWYT